MNPYQLNDIEKQAVAKLKQNYLDVQKIIEQKQKDLIAIQGAVDGMALLIASQQGMIVNGDEQVRFDTELTTISVVEVSA